MPILYGDLPCVISCIGIKDFKMLLGGTLSQNAIVKLNILFDGVDF